LGDGELGPVERVVTEREKLKRGIHLLGEAMEADALTLPSKTMNQDDREALERQMTVLRGAPKAAAATAGSPFTQIQHRAR
jgi:hypothetical protein